MWRCVTWWPRGPEELLWTEPWEENLLPPTESRLIGTLIKILSHFILRARKYQMKQTRPGRRLTLSPDPALPNPLFRLCLRDRMLPSNRSWLLISEAKAPQVGGWGYSRLGRWRRGEEVKRVEGRR